MMHLLQLLGLSKKVKIRPRNDFIVVSRSEYARKTRSGILIATAEIHDHGTVVAVGDGRKTKRGEIIPMQIKVGAKVMFNKYAGNLAKVDGRSYWLMREEDVMGILN